MEAQGISSAIHENWSRNMIGATRSLPSDSKDAKAMAQVLSQDSSHYEVKLKGQHPIPENIETAERMQPRRGVLSRLWMRWWAHLKRHTCFYFFVGIIFLAAFLPVFFLVIFPAIAQRMVDNAQLPIHSARILRPTPDSVEFTLSASLKVPRPFTVRLDPITLSLYRQETNPNPITYMNVSLPKMSLHGNSSVRVVNQTSKILNHDQFKNFLTSAVYSDTFDMAASGSTTAHLGKLRAKLRLDKVIKMNGLRKLSGFAITTARLVFPAATDGTNIEGEVLIPNHSIVTLDLGNLTLNLFVGGLKVGLGYIDNVLLPPGNNTIAIRGAIDINTLLQHITEVISSEAGALQGGQLELTASGNSTVYDGQHIPYLEDILNDLSLTTQVSIVTLISGSLGGLLNQTSGIIGNLVSDLNTTGLISSLIGN